MQFKIFDYKVDKLNNKQSYYKKTGLKILKSVLSIAKGEVNLLPSTCLSWL